MFDQHNAYTHRITPVHELVNFENTIQQLDIERAIQVSFLQQGKLIQFKYDGLVLTGKVERPLIHQLGGRAWKECQDFKSVNELWVCKFKDNPHALAQELASLFTRYDLRIRYYKDSKGLNRVYGIMTGNFVDVNQLDFRQNFIEQTRKITGLAPESKGFSKGSYGAVIEHFKFDNPAGFQTEFEYGLVYARNNGYEAYRVNWGRLIIICTNGLKRWEGGNKFAWRHTKDTDLADFITRTVADGVGNQRFLEERITACRETVLNRTGVNALMERMSLAQASKQRVVDRIAVEAKEVGYNEWALSQSLTWLGSHERSIQKRSQRQLTGLGTDILEHSLDEVLEEESKLYYDGSYGLVLPKGFKRGVSA